MRRYIAAMKVKDADIMFVAGEPEIDEGHWQARWQGRLSTGRQLTPDAGDLADPKRWSAKVAEAVNGAERPVILVAHGRGVTAALHAAAGFTAPVAGAFLVAPADPQAPGPFDNDNGGFAPYPRGPLKFPSLLVASRDDPACAFEVAEELAADWGSLFLDAGNAGRVDSASGFGPWPEGSMTFARFVSRLPAIPSDAG